MRKNILLTVFLSLFFVLQAAAQWTPTANLTIFSEDGNKFYLILNGEKYNDQAQTNIRVEELPNPYYSCKIIFENKAIPTISKSIQLTDANGMPQDVTYRIKTASKGKYVLRFYSMIPAEQNMLRPSNCTVYHFGQPNSIIAGPGYMQTTTQQQTYNQGMNNGNANMNVNVGVGGVGLNINVPVNTNVSGNVSVNMFQDEEVLRNLLSSLPSDN